MDKYKCIIGFETETKVYRFGDRISEEVYNSLTTSQQRFFIITKPIKGYVINQN